MSSMRRIMAAAIVAAGMLGARAHAAPPAPPPVPAAPGAPNPGGPCELSGDASDRADAATPLPFLLDNKNTADCAGDFGPAGVDTADWYWFEVRPTTATLTLVVQPTFGNAAFSSPLPNGDDVDAQLVGPDGAAVLPVVAGGRGQPHVFVVPQPAPGLYKIAVLPGPSTPTAHYSVVAALTGP